MQEKLEEKNIPVAGKLPFYFCAFMKNKLHN